MKPSRFYVEYEDLEEKERAIDREIEHERKKHGYECSRETAESCLDPVYYVKHKDFRTLSECRRFLKQQDAGYAAIYERKNFIDEEPNGIPGILYEWDNHLVEEF